LAYAAAIAAVVVAAAGTAYGAYTTHQQAQASAAAERYNELMQERQAKEALKQSAAAEDQQRRGQRELLGRQTAAAVETGFDLSGTPRELLGQSAADAEYDALLTRYKGQLQASGLSADAALSKAQAAGDTRYGSAALTSGLVSAGAQALGGYAKAYYGYGPGRSAAGATDYGLY
jgi:hypothetical protein